MKFFISADIEGITCVNNWSETEYGGQGYEQAKLQMSLEVAAACEGILETGEHHIVVRDAHGLALNIDPSLLPKEVQIIRGWAGTPEAMMEGIDSTYDGAIFIGYHSGATSEENPLAHTTDFTKLHSGKLNGENLSELRLNSYMAALYGVPCIFLSGDDGICKEMETLSPHAVTVPVKKGMGGATVNLNPKLSVSMIKDGIKKALKLDIEPINLPDSFELILDYKNHKDALKASFYPGIERVGERSVKLVTNDFRELLAAYMFLV